MNRKKTVVLIGSAHPLRGGLAAYNERLAREYQYQGAEVLLYSFSLQYPSLFFPGKSQYTSEPPPDGLTIKTRINSINPLSWIRVGKEIKKLKPDLVIVKFWMPFIAPCLGTICRIIRKNKHTRIISIIDNIIPHERRIGDKTLAGYFVRSVDGFVAMSRSVMDELDHFDQQKPKVFCPHPLYDNFGDAISKKDAIQKLRLDGAWSYVLFFGFIRDYKGLDLLLKAFADPRIREMKVKLLVAGEFYCDPKPFREIIDKHGLQDLVIMSNDFIPDSAVTSYFCAADLVVQPYKSATQSGVSQIAYHFNKPMVITNVGGLAEFVPDGKAGYVVQPDPTEIANAIWRFYKENKEEEFVSRVAIEKEKYSWKSMIEAINTLDVGRGT
ncbi:MAG: glycosyltransferase [Bacteroidales bacterium]|nr:glycosyltransferase [Bacteroidales bacterium]